ncbi:MAG: hypothetical protein H7249_15325 [Chitinophagaceae bacterium]|nr:hypothetical protein [Oligoflexus sp.]
MNLAFYGTLRDPDILQRVTKGELESRLFKIITVKGWACLRIEGEAYPLLRSDASACTAFHLYHECSEVSWRRLLAYEGDEYTFTVLTFEGTDYHVFMAEPTVNTSGEHWDFDAFQRLDKVRYLAELSDYSL